MPDCPFCRIISGDLEGIFVHQDELCSAFMSLQPINPGHLLVIPNDHIQNLENLPAVVSEHLFRIGQQLSIAIHNSGVECEGINFYLADGRAADQKIPHLHLHIIPRYEGDGFQLRFSPRYAELPTGDELEKNAYHIRQALELLIPPD